MKVLTMNELHAFIGLMYSRAALNWGNLCYPILFSEHGHDLFGATMLCNRFGFINAHLTFDDDTTRAYLWKTDRFAALRKVFDLFNTECAKYLHPSEWLTMTRLSIPCVIRLP